MTRKISILGDSISTFRGCNPDGFNVYYCDGRDVACGLENPGDTWWMQVIHALGGELLINGSWSGSMVEGAGYPAAWSPERLDALGSPEEPPDDVLVYIGINDYGWGGAASQAGGRSAAMPAATNLDNFPPAVAGEADEKAVARFKAAYRMMLSGMRERYPKATVWCFTLLPGRAIESSVSTHTWSLRGISMHRYCKAILEAAAEEGCKGIDVTAFGKDYEAIDGTHPTKLGMKQIASLMIAGLEGRSLVSEYPGSDGGVSWDSASICEAKSCVGCDWARGTGNSWYCVCERPIKA